MEGVFRDRRSAVLNVSGNRDQYQNLVVDLRPLGISKYVRFVQINGKVGFHDMELYQALVDTDYDFAYRSMRKIMENERLARVVYGEEQVTYRFQGSGFRDRPLIFAEGAKTLFKRLAYDDDGRMYAHFSDLVQKVLDEEEKDAPEEPVSPPRKMARLLSQQEFKLRMQEEKTRQLEIKLEIQRLEQMQKKNK